jgi:hypothetical protein
MDDVAVGIFVTGLTEGIEVVGHANEDDICTLPDLLARPAFGTIFVAGLGTNAAVGSLNAEAGVAAISVLFARRQVEATARFVKWQGLETGDIYIKLEGQFGPRIGGAGALVVSSVGNRATGTVATKGAELVDLPCQDLVFGPDTFQHSICAIRFAADNCAKALTLVTYTNYWRS